jgi:hypothetical protein
LDTQAALPGNIERCEVGLWQVCALWVPDVKVRQTPACEAVEGVSGLKPERWGVPCSICHSTRGVVLRCNSGHCTLPFHALCGRNAGQYLAVRPAAGKQLAYRAYCALHSETQRRKDLEGPALATPDVRAHRSVPPPPP